MTVSDVSMSLLARATNVQGKALSRPATPSSERDAEAIRLSSAVARGDPAAFGALYDAYHARVFRLAIMLGRGDEAVAHDVLQAVMIAAARKLKPLAGEDHLWNWLACVTRQQVAKVWRRRQQAPTLIELEPLAEMLSVSAVDASLEQSLDAALLELGGDERQIVEWFYFDGLSHHAIADQMSTTPKAISSRLERIRVKLRALVKRRLFDET